MISYITLMLSLLGVQSIMAAGDDRRAQIQARLEERFAQADVNADGKLSKDEAKEKMPRVYASFDKIDTEHSGYVTLKQIEQYLAGMAGKRHGSTE